MADEGIPFEVVVGGGYARDMKTEQETKELPRRSFAGLPVVRKEG